MRYEIRVASAMSAPMLEEGFPELESFMIAGDTVLVGQIIDEAHLYGLLARFQNLGLRITEIRQLPE
ncbi:hypothetical protein [Streptacidiphilus sp. EB129]|uniref:hypothetical protein n=1 Tax=Streptacidiphilus sp. EB129 TaxID=3156262 RepID=UPI00351830C8